MSETTTKSGLSNREYARRRRVSEAAIRRRRADGTLADAILPNGRLDPAKADELLAKGTTGGSRISKDLAEARRRKAAATVALLSDEVAVLNASVIPVEGAAAVVRESVLAIAERWWRIADVASEAMGEPADVAAGIVAEAVIVALEDVSGVSRDAPRDDGAEGLEDEPLPAQPDGPAFERLSAVELATMLADLQAAKLQAERDLNRGTIVRIADVHDMLCTTFANARSILLGVHARTAPQLGAYDEADEAVAYIEREVWPAIREMASEYVCAEELAAAGPLAAKRKRHRDHLAIGAMS